MLVGSAHPGQLLEAAAELRRELATFEPGVYSALDCARLAEELATTEKACGAARLLAAARAVACGAHRESGVADPARWIARQCGTTSRQAKDALFTATSLETCPSTKDAMLGGHISIFQAQEITKAEAELPGQEAALLEVAKDGDLTTLRDEVRERRLQSIPPDDLHRRQVAARRFRHWRDGLGLVCFEGALPPETGIPFVSRIEREAARRHREARRSGATLRFEACAADALVALNAQEGAGKRGPNVDLVIVCDVFAWRRGHHHPGEPCHLIGGGPIPVEVAKELSQDAFLKVVLHDGKDIHKVKHHGRRYTAELLTALDLGPVPAFNGRACAGCDRKWGLERDHEVPVARTGPTSYENVQDLCYACHLDKTERDRAAGLLATALGREPAPPASTSKRSGSRTLSPRRSRSQSPDGTDPP